MWVGGWNGGGLDDTPSSDDVVPPLAQIHLLGRGTGPLSFLSGRLACGNALSAALGRLLCKGRLRLLPLHSHGSSLYGFPRSHSTEAVPAG